MNLNKNQIYRINLKFMKILITGSSGFIGSNLVEFLNKKKIYTIGIDKNYPKFVDCKKFYKLNLLNKNRIKKIFTENKITHVIHCAAISGIKDCEKNKKKAYQYNFEILNILLNNSLKFNVKKFLFLSSFAVKNIKKNPNYYAKLKYKGEKIVQIFNSKTAKGNYIVCRLSNVFGPFSLHKKSVIHNFIKKIINNKKIKIDFDGNQKRDFIFVKNLCQKLLILITKKSKINKIQNLNSGKKNKIIDVKERLQIIFKKKIKYSIEKENNFRTITRFKKNDSFNKSLLITKKWFQNNY